MGVTGIKYDEETVDKEIVRGLLAPSLNNTLKFEESQSAIRAMYLQKNHCVANQMSKLLKNGTTCDRRWLLSYR